MQRTIDLNSDLGKGDAPRRACDDSAMLRPGTSAHHVAMTHIVRETLAAEGCALAPFPASL